MPGVDILATAFNGANAAFIADLYARWVRDPASVDPEFRDPLRGVERRGPVRADGCLRRVLGAAPVGDRGRGRTRPAQPAAQARRRSAKRPGRPTAAGIPMSKAEAAAHAHDDTINSIRALMLIRAYRVRGHLEAKLDPLGQQVPRHHPELDPATYGFTPADYDKPIFIDNLLGRETATIREILAVPGRHLLRLDRHRVHAYPGHGAERLAAAPDRGFSLARADRPPRPRSNCCRS